MGPWWSQQESLIINFAPSGIHICIWEEIEIPNQDEDIGEEEDKDLKPLNRGVR